MLIGKQFGRYEIRRQIGAGGMGEVYLAYDAELDRSVAVKILPLEFSDDADRKSRFRQEARAASALNHPNIITIYEIGENEHGSFLATELIEGETLREIIKRHKLSVAEILRIVEQIAKALTAAHQAHIVHRDIKPENIMLRSDGIVKILDFGLAKPTVQKHQTNEEAINTIPGLVMGSARYMSPEQARGLAVDERTDIWSLGVVLYEMLTGNAPFDGATTSDTIAAVIYKDPVPLGNFIENVPPELSRIIRKALQKDREERYQNVKDFALDVKDLLHEIEHNGGAEKKYSSSPNLDISENATIIHRTDSANHPTLIHQTNSANHPTKTSVLSTANLELGRETPKKHHWKMWQIALASLAAVVLFGLAFSLYKSSGTASNAAAAFEKSQVSRLSSDGKVSLPAISPDGKYVAYVNGETGNRSLVVRQISTDSLITVVPPTILEYKALAFSPAGDYIFYTQTREDFSVNTLYQIPTLGGTPKKLIEDVDSAPTFSPDGKRFAFVRHTSKISDDVIFIADTNDLNPQKFVSSKETGFDAYSKSLAWSPDGTKILVGADKNQFNYGGTMEFVEIAVADKKLRILPSRDFYLIGNFCWFKDGSGFLFSAQEESNSPVQIWRYNDRIGETQPITNDFNNYTELGLSADGQTIVTIKGESVSSLWRFTPAGKEIIQLTSDSRSLEGMFGLAQMPDGKLFYSKNDGRKIDFQLADADGKNPFNITGFSETIYSPVPTPNGRYIVFSSKMSKTPRIWRMDVDGKNPVQLSDENIGYSDFNPQVTADGKTVIFDRQNKGDRSALYKVSIEGGQTVPFFDNEKWSISQPRISPDGKLIAFTEYDIDTFDKHIVVASLNGDVFGNIEKSLEYNLLNSVKWSPDSRDLTVSSNQKGVPNIFRLPLDGTPPQPLTDFRSGKILNFAWSKDGKSIFIVRGISNNDLILINDSSKDANK